MSITRGGLKRRKKFECRFDNNTQSIIIENEDGRIHTYSAQEIAKILQVLHQNFKSDSFPLANNVEWLGNGTEKMGLGRAILGLDGSDVNHGQGSSYLGVVLEECGYLKWNGKPRGIRWWLKNTDFTLPTITARLVAVNAK